jgi:cyclohexanone monooxygenase
MAGVTAARRHVGVAIIGTGFSGLGTAIRLRQAGISDLVLLDSGLAASVAVAG